MVKFEPPRGKRPLIEIIFAAVTIALAALQIWSQDVAPPAWVQGVAGALMAVLLGVVITHLWRHTYGYLQRRRRQSAVEQVMARDGLAAVRSFLPAFSADVRAAGSVLNQLVDASVLSAVEATAVRLHLQTLGSWMKCVEARLAEQQRPRTVQFNQAIDILRFYLRILNSLTPMIRQQRAAGGDTAIRNRFEAIARDWNVVVNHANSVGHQFHRVLLVAGSGDSDSGDSAVYIEAADLL